MYKHKLSLAGFRSEELRPQVEASSKERSRCELCSCGSCSPQPPSLRQFLQNCKAISGRAGNSPIPLPSTSWGILAFFREPLFCKNAPLLLIMGQQFIRSCDFWTKMPRLGLYLAEKEPPKTTRTSKIGPKRSARFLSFRLLAIALLMLLSFGWARNSKPVAAEPGDWWAEYFSNSTLGGAPVVSRYDSAINFSWGTGSPGYGLPNDNFSIRWGRDEWFAGGTYRFKVLADDGVRVWVGDQLVVDEWRDRWATPLNIDHYIPQGAYRVRVEYYEHTGDATMSIGWRRIVGGETWYGEYFNCRDLAGSPALVRNEAAIDFDWGGSSPDSAITVDNFSARWTRTLNFNAGDYRFLASTDDGVRIWVDTGLVVDAWEDHQPKTHIGEAYLADGQHTITVEYFEHNGPAKAHVWWESQETFTGWRGEYFDNPDLIGGPAMERNDVADQEGTGLNFDWGVAPPATWMPDDNFSVRWKRQANFTPGYYRFALQSDDGVRLWIDQSILIDKWQDMDYELHYVDGVYLEGLHTIRLEYYEHTGNAHVRFWWETGTNDNTPPDFAPVESDAVAAEPEIEGGPWEATYFAGSALSGDPILTRTETEINHNWGWKSPKNGVPQNFFSARWTQSLHFPAGVYRFTTYTDDGVRLWVDDQIQIDSWRPMRGYRNATIRLSEGVHDVRMEYYERTGVALARLNWKRLYR